LKVAHRLCRACKEDIGLEPNQFGGKFSVAFRFCFGKTPFNDKISALDITELSQPLRKPSKDAGFQHGWPGRAGKNADPLLKQVLESAHGQGETLAAKAGIADGVQRIGDQAALFAYADSRFLGLWGEGGGASAVPAPLLLALGKRASLGYLRLEISKPAIDLALHSALGL